MDTVYVASTTTEHGEEAAQAINEQVNSAERKPGQAKSGKAIFRQLDLGDLHAVKDFAGKISEELKVNEQTGEGGLDYLIDNAGIGVAAYSRTKDDLACQ